LRGKSADELLQQAGKLARDNPTLFLAGSVALGFGLSRFLRASSPASTATMSPPSSTTPSEPSDPMGNHYKTQVSTIVAADEEVPILPPHMDDVYHSARPGVADRSASPDATGTGSAAGAFVPIDPLGSSATYPDTGPGNREFPEADRSLDGSSDRGISRGDV
jgi:hypothetical protein